MRVEKLSHRLASRSNYVVGLFVCSTDILLWGCLRIHAEPSGPSGLHPQVTVHGHFAKWVVEEAIHT